MVYIIATDDDRDVRETIGRILRRDDYDVQLAESGKRTLELVEHKEPDLLILDIMMPGLSGLEVCKRLRRDPRYVALPIIFLTAITGTDRIVEGLEAGADDYISKPFAVSELRARVSALLRRTDRSASSGQTTLEVGDFQLDSTSHQVFLNGSQIQLTATEHRLLRFLMENVNQALTLSQLLQGVWQYPPNVGDPDLVRSHIRNLRSKVKKYSEFNYIRTIHGVGYVFQTKP